jgi:hypothetical protein
MRHITGRVRRFLTQSRSGVCDIASLVLGAAGLDRVDGLGIRRWQVGMTNDCLASHGVLSLKALWEELAQRSQTS